MIQNTEPLDAEIEEAGKPLSGDLWNFACHKRGSFPDSVSKKRTPLIREAKRHQKNVYLQIIAVASTEC